MSEQNKKQPWKAFEDQKLKEEREKAQELALFVLKGWLKEHSINFTENEKGNLINIHSDVLISRKEMIKLLIMTKGNLGIQFHLGEIGIYELHSKINK